MLTVCIKIEHCCIERPDRNEPVNTICTYFMYPIGKYKFSVFHINPIGEDPLIVSPSLFKDPIRTTFHIHQINYMGCSGFTTANVLNSRGIIPLQMKQL